MVEVILQEKADNYIFSMNGHAEYAKSGCDIVCAACSALAFTLLGAMENLCPTCILNSRARSGSFFMQILKNRDAGIVMNAIMIGFLQIQKQYPNYVSVYYK